MYLRRREILPTLTQEPPRDNAAEVAGMPNLTPKNIASPEGAAKSASAARPAHPLKFSSTYVLDKSAPLRSRPLPVTTATKVATIRMVPANTGANTPP
jgi:hypothetical protein